MNGVLLVDKAAGVTSRFIDNQIRRKVGRDVRVGHAGTLDPFATGLLPVMIGEATKLSAFLTGGAKHYWARLRLGEKTATADCDGPVIEAKAIPGFDASHVLGAMAQLKGKISQTPPMYSAIKQGGRPLYEMARAGESVVVPPRMIDVYEWSLDSLGEQTIEFTVRCGPGTYVRTLGEQLAELLGTVGHLTALRRMKVGRHSVADAVSLEEACDRLPLVALEAAIGLPVVRLDADASREIRFGRPILLPNLEMPADEASQPLVLQALDETGKLIALLNQKQVSASLPWRVLRGFQ